MASVTKGGAEFDPAAIERVEWLAQRDLGTTVPATPALDPTGHWTRFLRDSHPPRFPAPGGVAVSEAVDDAGNFGASAAFGLRLGASVEGALASLPGRPGWRCYLADGSKPAALATFAEGDVVLVAVDASAEAGRRSPARAALLHRALTDAIDGGARVIGARVDEDAADHADTTAGLLLAGFAESYRCPRWVDAGLPAS
jgi:hypothetical protein